MPKIKQIIEDTIATTLSGDAKTNALAFVQWLRENKYNPANTSTNGWKLSGKGSVIAYIWLRAEEGYLTVCPFIGEYAPNAATEAVKEATWAKQTPACGDGCHVLNNDGYNCSYKLKSTFGKKYKHACARAIVFDNPTAKEYDSIQQLLELRRHTIKTGTKMPNGPTNYQ